MLSVAIEKTLDSFHLRASFEAGDEVVALFGPSGSGKSMTLQCIAGLLRPDAGRITIGDQVVFDSRRGMDLPPQRRRVGYVFQSYALMPHLNVAENIGYGLRVEKREREETVARMVELMRLKGLELRQPAQLSGGQQQRVALARALIVEPALLLLDEPLSALDSPIRGRLRMELAGFLHDLKITTVLVTHDLEEAYTLSRKLVVYDSGQVLQVGTREEVVNRPKSRAVARFTGAKNIFSGVVVSSSSDGLQIEGEGLSILAPASKHQKGDRVEFCIRPEHIMLVRPGRGAGDPVKENQLEGRIVQEINHGDTVTLLFKASALDNGKDYDLQIEVPTHVYQKLGLEHNKAWTVSLKKNAIHVF
ncbi:MAG: ABC transporter ATP-binding protein [Chloroflexi bacterium]|nr:ABC transporter ATP-binding protein [Chloroflexota bacterium]